MRAHEQRDPRGGRHPLDAQDGREREAGDGAEALDKARARVFDLVVTDHNMPRMDGVTLVRALRALPEYDDVALIVLSTETGAELKAKGREAGATGWMAKPFDPQKMLDIVRQFIA